MVRSPWKQESTRAGARKIRQVDDAEALRREQHRVEEKLRHRKAVGADLDLVAVWKLQGTVQRLCYHRLCFANS